MGAAARRLLVVLLALPACAGGEPAAGGATPPAVPGGAGCPPGGLSAGLHLGLTVTQGRIDRPFDLNIPAAAAGPAPVVVVLHPLGQGRAWGRTAAGMVVKSDAEGFIAVFPEGTAGSWNGGTCCGQAALTQVDDVGFIRAVLARVRQVACVDDTRVYATGFSNGGFLSHRLACEASDLFAAVAPDAAVLGIPAASCQPGRAVPVLQIHGTEDLLVPYNGGLLGPSSPATAAAWAERDGCTAPAQETFRDGAASCTTYGSCRDGAEVSLCTIEGGGHCWFGEGRCAIGRNPPGLRATDAAWAFLSRFHR
jgi:polyhydroxybutyrate depolymerase